MRCLYRLKPAVLCLFALLEAACSFDYGTSESGVSDSPDIVMEDLDYARVRGGRMIARLRAETAERYETRRRMELKNYSFEQYNTTNAEVDALGAGGVASVELDTSNVHMSSGVEIIVDTEDMILETERLDWDDGKKTLKGGENSLVKVEQSDGTNFTGIGFSADVRSRNWLVASDASGVYVHDDEEEDNDDADKNDAVEIEEWSPAEAAGRGAVPE
ncbi:MAG: LPS export ABC transporter periplasmic protein LptC [Spirochaetaceae bacterium]|jgi:LPS export ABC transporter protein LptC|nr:LPS export ABC transporter periplasmic protein LptC [Spirochaetaceae bacterium]